MDGTFLILVFSYFLRCLFLHGRFRGFLARRRAEQERLRLEDEAARQWHEEEKARLAREEEAVGGDLAYIAFVCIG